MKSLFLRKKYVEKDIIFEKVEKCPLNITFILNF